MRLIILVAVTLLSFACSKTETPKYAIALHGGAGTLDKSASVAEQQKYRESLRAALKLGQDELARGGTALDAVQKVVVYLENDEKFNAGKGAVYTERGTHELDASVMDGKTLACGAVAGVTTVKNPILLARAVMEKSGHVLLMSDGAEAFANTLPAIERVPNSYFDTPVRFEQLQKKLEQRRKDAAAKPAAAVGATGAVATGFVPAERSRGTVGCVALDSHGNLAAATSTGGLTAKRYGRVGDSPVIGAGTYANNKSAAISCTGTGEEFIRHTVARDVAALVEYKGLSIQQAADELIFHKLQPDDGGLIAISHTGDIAFSYSSTGMYRGAANSNGLFEVGIFPNEK